MKFSFETATTVTPDKIWSLYEDVKKWFLWEDHLESIELNGEFKKGSAGKMTLFGQPPMEFILTSVEINKNFTVKSTISNVGDIYFHHELIPAAVIDKTRVKHSVEFISTSGKETVEDSKFIAKIFLDVPSNIYSLIGAAQNE
jgi:hypothetical protein